MAFKLTPEQQKELDSMTSYKEREEFMELCKLEADYSEGNPPEPEPTPAPAPEPVSQPVVAEPAPVAEVKADEGFDWRAEAETWKKRKGDADRALGPVQQENARLRKEVEASDSKFEDLKSMLLKLQEEVAASKTPQRDADLEADEEFAQAYPDVANRIRLAEERAARMAKASVDERLRAIEEGERIRAEALERERQKAYEERHEAAVRKVHPDLGDLFDPNKLAPRLAVWANTQPPMVKDAVMNPLAHTPEDVAYALSAFKASEMPSAAKPSLGDMVQNAKSKTHVADPVQLDYFSEDELSEKNINALLRASRNDPAAMDAIVAKYERSLMQSNR